MDEIEVDLCRTSPVQPTAFYMFLIVSDYLIVLSGRHSRETDSIDLLFVQLQTTNLQLNRIVRRFSSILSDISGSSTPVQRPVY